MNPDGNTPTNVVIFDGAAFVFTNNEILFQAISDNTRVMMTSMNKILAPFLPRLEPGCFDFSLIFLFSEKYVSEF
jgi:hypothetical protein